VKVARRHNVSAYKIAIIQAQISCRRSNLVKITPEPSATRSAMFKVMRSNTEITITPPRIAWLRSNLVQSFTTSQAIHYTTNVQDQRSKVKVTAYSNVSAAKTLHYSNGCWVTSNLAWRRNYSGKGLAWLGRPQVAMHSQLPLFQYLNYYTQIITRVCPLAFKLEIYQ